MFSDLQQPTGEVHPPKQAGACLRADEQEQVRAAQVLGQVSQVEHPLTVNAALTALIQEG